MRNTRILILIALGSSLLISAFTSGMSIISIKPPVMARQESPAPELYFSSPRSFNCIVCHAAPVEWVAQNITSLQARIMAEASISHHDATLRRRVIDADAIYAVLTAHPQEQSIRMQSYTGPIVQCGFCHSNSHVLASMPIGKHE